LTEGYADRMLALQALAAENTQAAEELLRRMQPTQMSAAHSAASEQSRDSCVNRESPSADTEPWSPEERLPEETVQALRRSETARTQLLQRLTALAEPRTYLTDGAGAPKYGTAEPQARSGTQAALARMQQRLTRAVQPVGMPTAQTLPADGARDIAPGGTAEAAALSRMFERDARRYDGCFEMPL